MTTHPIIHLTESEFAALPEYSCSLPTGTTYGKRWKCHTAAGRASTWFMGEYYDCGSRTEVGIRWFLIDRTEYPDAATVLQVCDA